MKNEAYRYCQQFVEQRLAAIQKQMAQLQESLGSETKSTAGDKHETGRAMLQLEREKMGRQLQEAEKMALALKKVSLQANSEKVGLGSLVTTDVGCYFLAIAVGKIEVTGQVIFCISPAAPIGRLLLGKETGDEIQFNGQTQRILQVD